LSAPGLRRHVALQSYNAVLDLYLTPLSSLFFTSTASSFFSMALPAPESTVLASLSLPGGRTENLIGDDLRVGARFGDGLRLGFVTLGGHDAGQVHEAFFSILADADVLVARLTQGFRMLSVTSGDLLVSEQPASAPARMTGTTARNNSLPFLCLLLR
jgi:hypothetical protein